MTFSQLLFQGVQKVDVDGFGHLDFLWAKEAKEKLFPKIVEKYQS